MSKLKIGADVVSKNRVNFDGGIHTGYLKEVGIKLTGKEGEEKETLVFNFVSSINPKDLIVKEFNHNEYQIEETDAKFETKFEALQKRIKHIYEAFAPYPVSGIEVPDNATFLDLLKEIANHFNKNINEGIEGKEANTMFQGRPVRLKITYNNKGYTQFPYSPNFIEPASNKVSMLQINPTYDKITPPIKTNIFEQGGGNSAGYPDLGAGDGVPF